MIKTVCPHCGEEVVIETPETTRRGKLTGIALSDMTDEQLKVEIVNASSVLTKAKKRGAAEETILLAEARLDAAKAEKANRPSMNVARGPKAKKEDAVVEGTPDSQTEATPADEATPVIEGEVFEDGADTEL